MARRRFLRTDWRFHSKLGRGRKKLQKYRRPTGRHNKLREKVRGNPRAVSIGFKKLGIPANIRLIKNVPDLEKVKKSEKIIIAKVGMKNKIKIAEMAKKMNLRIENLNLNKFLEEIKK